MSKNFEATESSIKLQGWEALRKVVVIRQKVKVKSKASKGRPPKENISQSQQLSLPFNLDEELYVYKYSVLVTNLNKELLTIFQLYRDRSSSENNFDELKNQWGWSGFTTKDIKRSQIMAKIIALFYNWWTIFVRLTNPNKHQEAKTSRPLLLYAVGKKVKHGNKTKIIIKNMHAKADEVIIVLKKISKYFFRLKQYAEQMTSKQRYQHIIYVAFKKYYESSGTSPPKLAIKYE